MLILATTFYFFECHIEYCNEKSRDLTEEEKQRQLHDWYSHKEDWIPNFHLFPSLSNRRLKGNETNPILLGYYLLSRKSQRLTKKKCKRKSKNRDIMDWATCPWYLNFGIDTLRYPMILVTADCKCQKCIHSGSNRTECVPLKARVKVLRRKLSNNGTALCSNGKALYESTWETINTACTCVFRRTSKQKNIHVVSRP